MHRDEFTDFCKIAPIQIVADLVRLRRVQLIGGWLLDCDVCWVKAAPQISIGLPDLGVFVASLNARAGVQAFVNLRLVPKWLSSGREHCGQCVVLSYSVLGFWVAGCRQI